MHFICLIIVICTLHTKLQNIHACRAAGGAKLEQELLFSVMTLQYHTVYQISSLEANLSLEDKKTALRQKPPTQVYLP